MLPNYCFLLLVQQFAVPEKNPYPPHGRSSEIPMGRGVLRAKILEAKYEAKLEFLGGRGCKTKTFRRGWGGWYGYLLKLHISLLRVKKQYMYLKCNQNNYLQNIFIHIQYVQLFREKNNRFC